MSIIVLFFIISVLFAIEASTSLARVAGLNANNLASGLQLQSGLSLFSRALMAIFMPSLGAMADAGSLNKDNLITLYCSTLLIPTAVFATYIFKSSLIRIYNHAALNLINKGSYFPFGISEQIYISPNHVGFGLRKLLFFRIVTLLSYLPYYLSWSVIILLLSFYPNDRGLIIGLSSIMNGLNTLALILYVDPFLIKLSRHKRLSNFVYQDQIKIRILSAALASVPFLLTLIYILVVNLFGNAIL